jgi:phosphoserine phosphatase RsbU/P
LALVISSLLAATLIFGPLPIFYRIHMIVMSASLLLLMIDSLREKDTNRDFVIMRAGLLINAIFSLSAFVAGILRLSLRPEPYGFAILLGCLGYVAARDALRRELELHQLGQELEIARRIQRSTLPQRFPESENFQVVGRYVPMTAVAGDLYDVLVSGDHEAGLLIADVSGHGVPAALICSMVKLASTMLGAYVRNPSDLLSKMNGILCGNTQSQFVTAAYAYVNADSNELRYSAAGHPPMLLLRGGDVTALEENGLLLGAFRTAQYKTRTYSLEPGDRLLLYTDGIVESADSSQSEFGQDRLCALLQQTAQLPPAETADLIMSTVRGWSSSQEDDLTLLLCDFKPSAALNESLSPEEGYLCSPHS